MVTGDARFLQRSRDLRHLLNGEWIVHTLVALSAGPLHYNELHAAIQEMTTFDPWTGTVRRIQSRALGRTLRRMETSGLVEVGEELEITLSGWAVPVYAGRLADELIKELHAIE